jgi:positive regulator of sigma E activity
MTAFDVALVILLVSVWAGFVAVKLYKRNKRRHHEQHPVRG